jgi:hypothetical protein
MQMHELFNMKGELWFCRGKYHYTLAQVQRIIIEKLRADPERAQDFLDEFIPCEKPKYK